MLKAFLGTSAQASSSVTSKSPLPIDDEPRGLVQIGSATVKLSGVMREWVEASECDDDSGTEENDTNLAPKKVVDSPLEMNVAEQAAVDLLAKRGVLEIREIKTTKRVSLLKIKQPTAPPLPASSFPGSLSDPPLPGSSKGMAELEQPPLPGSSKGMAELLPPPLPGSSKGMAELEQPPLPGSSKGMAEVDMARPFFYAKCNLSFGRRKYLNDHKKTSLHTQVVASIRRFKCTVCNDEFTKNRSLKEHMLRHSGEKPYNCEVCNKAFRRHGTMVYHMPIHSGEKPFACQHCGESFRSKAYLNVHIRRLHPA